MNDEPEELGLTITGSELADILHLFAVDLLLTLAPQTGDEKLETLANHLFETGNGISTPGPRKAVLLVLAKRLMEAEAGPQP
jgi:hypothetical protein